MRKKKKTKIIQFWKGIKKNHSCSLCTSQSHPKMCSSRLMYFSFFKKKISKSWRFVKIQEAIRKRNSQHFIFCKDDSLSLVSHSPPTLFFFYIPKVVHDNVHFTKCICAFGKIFKVNMLRVQGFVHKLRKKKNKTHFQRKIIIQSTSK